MLHAERVRAAEDRDRETFDEYGRPGLELEPERRSAPAGGRPSRDALEAWRDTFGGGELVAEGVQASLWLGDVDTPRPATLAEIEQRAGELVRETERG